MQITQSLNSNPSSKNIKASHLTLKYNYTDEAFSFLFPLKAKEYNLLNDAESLTTCENENFVRNIEHIKSHYKQQLSFQLDRNQYVKEILNNNIQQITLPYLNENPRNVVVEFSSPNIAKPFHVGHLRSTIIGNYIANLNRFLSNKVTTINYLGDWGTQFGFVQLGLKLANISESALKEDPINSLYKAYVYANNLSKEDPTINDKAREIFKLLEEGNDESLKEWEILRRHTVEELKKTYSRIGIKFDEYHWESMYNAKKLETLFSELERLQLLTTDEESRKVIRLGDKRIVPLLKSDGSTLYITRDIAAAIDRFNEYKFDDMYYVVDNAQSEHFTRLVSILERMEFPWAKRLKHVKFGKIRGMSTRKGTAVFLNDILDETRAVMKEKQIQSPSK